MKIKTFVILLVLATPASAFQPDDSYELDEYEIACYIDQLKADPEKHKEEIEKFEIILEENIQDEKEYQEKYGEIK